MLRRAWHSPTLTTWASLATRSLNLVVVLPLALRQFTPVEVAVWQLFFTIVTLQLLLDLGLTPTFTRLIAFAMGGAENFRDLRKTERAPDSEHASPNWKAIETIWSTMNAIYGWLALAAFILLAVFGTAAMWKPMSALENPLPNWIAWGLVAITSPLTFRSTPWSAYLQGLNQIALVRRWDALTALGAILCSLLVLAFHAGLVALILTVQVWSIIGILRNRHLARSIAGGRLGTFSARGLDREMFSSVWPAAWRSGMGVLITGGFVQLTGLLYAQLARADQAAQVAAYLVGLRYITAVNQFSQAPFYSKLPLLARLHAEGRDREVAALAQRGMSLSLWVFLLGAALVGLAMPGIMQLTGSRLPFVEPFMWWLLAAAFFAERFGAMHLQLYSTTNHIVWHIVTAVSGTINLAVLLVLYPLIGPYAFPVSILAGYCGFFCWFSAGRAYRAFGLNWFHFERTVSLPVLAAFGLTAGLHLWFARR